MDIVSRERNYIPIDLVTRFYACKRVKESKWKIRKACSFYHIKRASLFRWLKVFDGTEESLIDHSHRTKTPNEIELELKEEFIRIRVSKDIKSPTSIES